MQSIATDVGWLHCCVPVPHGRVGVTRDFLGDNRVRLFVIGPRLVHIEPDHVRHRPHGTQKRGNSGSKNFRFATVVCAKFDHHGRELRTMFAKDVKPLRG